MRFNGYKMSTIYAIIKYLLSHKMNVQVYRFQIPLKSP